MSQRLGTLINENTRILGSTDAGSDWVMKALNPSSEISIKGMPDKTSSSTVMYNFDQALVIEPPASSSVNESWNYDIRCHAHPIAFCDVVATPQSAPTDISNSLTYLNAQLPENPTPPAATGVLWTDKVAATTANYLYKTSEWQKMCQHARLCYFGITVTQSASSQNDQGQLVAGQQAQTPVVTSVIDTVNGQIINQYFYGNEDFATFNNLPNLAKHYEGVSRDGCYQAMKLDEDYTSFKSQVTPVSIFSSTIGATTGSNGSVPSPQMLIAITNGTRGIGLMGTEMPQIIIKGVAPGTTFRCRFRVGIEVKPFAGSSNTPFATISPRYDVMALEMYSKLMLEVEQDGYPADYNLFEWLGKAINKVAPYLMAAGRGALSGISGGVPGILSGALGGLSEEIARPSKKRKVEFYPE